MSPNKVISDEVSGSEQPDDQCETNGCEGSDPIEAREGSWRPSVALEGQARVDTGHPAVGRRGLTLAAEERLEAREWEIARTRRRWDRRQESDREQRSRVVVGRVSADQRYEFAERAGSVNRWLDPATIDPREQLSRAQLGAVNRETKRISEQLDNCGWSRAAISRRLAEQIVDGLTMESAAMNVIEQVRTAPGQVVPIGILDALDRAEVSIQGVIVALWDASSSAIQQVGLMEDETGRTKFTTWVKSDQPMVQEGDTVRLRDVVLSWYDGRVSVALTGRSSIRFVDTGQSEAVDCNE